MDINNTNYIALLHVILFIFALFFLALATSEKKDAKELKDVNKEIDEADHKKELKWVSPAFIGKNSQ